MDAFIYQAALYCPDCTRRIKQELKKEGKDPRDFEDEHTYDSDEYPKGPFSEGGGEADSPQHCDTCHVFLENPLTSDGEDYVREAVREDHEERKHGKKANPVVGEWKEFYDYIDYGIDEEDHREEMEQMLEDHGFDPAEAGDLSWEQGVTPEELKMILADPEMIRRYSLRLLRPIAFERGDDVVVRAYRAAPGRGLIYSKFRGTLLQDLGHKSPWDEVKVERDYDGVPISVYVFSIDQG